MTDQEIILSLRESKRKLTESHDDICAYADALEVKCLQYETKCKLYEDILKEHGLLDINIKNI